MSTDLATLKVKVQPDGVAATKSQLDNLATAGGGATTAIGGLATKFAALGAAMVAAGVTYGAKKLFELGIAAINTGKQFETLGVQLGTVMGSIAEGEKAMDWVERFTVNTPYQLEDVGKAFVKLKNFGIEPTTGAMQAIADQASALGGSAETLNALILALGKAYSKGRLSGEEWVMLMERGVPAAKLMSEALGVTEGKLADMMRAGQLGREEIDLFIKKMGEATGGASLALMDTFEGKWSNLQDQIAQTLNQIAEAGLLDAATETIEDMIEILDSLDPNAIKLFTEAFVDGFRAVRDAALGLVEPLKNMAIGFAAIIEMTTAYQLGKLDTEKIERLTASFQEAARKVAAEADNLDRLKKQVEAGVLDRSVLAGNLEEYRAASKEMKEIAVVLMPLIDRQEKLEKRHRSAVRTIDSLVNGFEDLKDAEVETTGATVERTEAQEAATEADEEAAEATEKVKTVEEERAELLDRAKQSLQNARMAQARFSETIQALRRAAEAAGLGVRGLLSEIRFLGDDSRDTDEKVDDLADSMTAAEKAAEAFGGTLESGLTSGLSSLFGDAFSGEIDNFGESVISMFGDIGEESARTFGQALASTLFGGDEADGIGALFDSFDEMSGQERAAMGLGGAVGVYQATQMQSRGQGALAGAMGGAQVGFAIGGGPWGAVVGAVVGAVAGYLGAGGDSDPETRLTIGAGGFGTDVFTSYQSLRGSPAEDRAARELTDLFRSNFLNWRDIVKQFQDPSLWENFEFPEIYLNETRLTLDEALRYMADVGIPDAMREAFGEMLRTGFENLGVDEEFTRTLFSELSYLSGPDQMEALTAVIQALVGLQDLEAGGFDALLELTDQDTLETFGGQASNMIDQIALLGMGFEDMSLSERAAEVNRMVEAFGGFEQATAAMLQQLQAARDSVSGTFGRMAEGVTLEMMGSDLERGQYLYEQVQGLMSDLESASSTEEVTRISGEIARYLQMLQGLDLEGFDPVLNTLWSGITGGPGDQTFNEWLLGMLSEADTLAASRFDEIEQEIRDTYDEVRDAALGLGDAFLDLTEIAEAFGEAFDYENPDVVNDDVGDVEPVGPEPTVEEVDETGIPWWKSGTPEGTTSGTEMMRVAAVEATTQTALLIEQTMLLRRLVESGARPIVINAGQGAGGRSTGGAQAAVY